MAEFGQKIQMPFFWYIFAGDVFHKSVSKKNEEVTYMISAKKKKKEATFMRSVFFGVNDIIIGLRFYLSFY
jgi:hypothetical protein